jgi:PhnB protein
MLGINPYLTFNGNCAEAMNFYKDSLEGEMLVMQRFGESPMKGMGDDAAVLHCQLRIGDSVLMASDAPPEQSVNAGTNLSLSIGLDDVEKARAYFDRLSVGGTVMMPLSKTFWAEAFGMLTDKYGINWMINCDAPQV